jgi:uncharacterized iron-regulated membrane protein
MLKAYILRFHRWLTLIFAVPLLVIIVTGLILSFLPLMQQTELDKPLTKTDLLGYLAKHDPDSKATGLALVPYENSLTITGVGPDGEIEIDLTSGAVTGDDGGFAWSEVIRTSRRLHETLIYDMGWLVTASTFAMLAIATLGILMGLPRLRNSVGGWHNLAAWSTLPLVIISPLTGLALAYGITFLSPQSGPRLAPIAIAKAVEIIAEKHDLNNLIWLRTRGGRQSVRLYGDDGARVSLVTEKGLVTGATNWPRAIHEGNWSRVLAPVLNIIVSIVFIGLWFTGLFIWVRRTFLRKRYRVRETSQRTQPAE